MGEAGGGLELGRRVQGKGSLWIAIGTCGSLVSGGAEDVSEV